MGWGATRATTVGVVREEVAVVGRHAPRGTRRHGLSLARRASLTSDQAANLDEGVACTFESAIVAPGNAAGVAAGEDDTVIWSPFMRCSRITAQNVLARAPQLANDINQQGGVFGPDDVTLRGLDVLQDAITFPVETPLHSIRIG